MSGLSVGLERSNQSAQSRGKNDQVTSSGSRGVGVGDTGRDEHRFPRTDRFCSIGAPKNQFTFQNVPGLIIGMMNRKPDWATAAPFVYLK